MPAAERTADGRKKHGPYWYAYWTDGKGRLRSRYVGVELPDGARTVAAREENVVEADGGRKYGGRASRTVRAWCELTGLPLDTVRRRLAIRGRSGWTVEDCLFRPVADHAVLFEVDPGESFGGKASRTIAEWCKVTGNDPTLVKERLAHRRKSGWSVTKCILMPTLERDSRFVKGVERPVSRRQRKVIVLMTDWHREKARLRREYETEWKKARGRHAKALVAAKWTPILAAHEKKLVRSEKKKREAFLRERGLKK